MTKENIRIRNWQKMRLMGMTIDMRVLTDEEVVYCRELLYFRDYLIEHWDRETEILIGHSLPPHKCCSCGRRFWSTYTLPGM